MTFNDFVIFDFFYLKFAFPFQSWKKRKKEKKKKRKKEKKKKRKKEKKKKRKKDELVRRRLPKSTLLMAIGTIVDSDVEDIFYGNNSDDYDYEFFTFFFY